MRACAFWWVPLAERFFKGGPVKGSLGVKPSGLELIIVFNVESGSVVERGEFSEWVSMEVKEISWCGAS